MFYYKVIKFLLNEWKRVYLNMKCKIRRVGDEGEREVEVWYNGVYFYDGNFGYYVKRIIERGGSREIR